MTFVIARISDQAEQSGAPLSEGEIDFLHHPPTQPTNPTASWGIHTADQDSWPILALRDFGFEDSATGEGRAFARSSHPPGCRTGVGVRGAVLQLHRHPLSWLLQWAHIRTAQRPARWDRLLLWATATPVVVVFILGAVALSVVTDGRKMFGSGLCVLSADASMSHLSHFLFGVRRLEARQRQQNIEKFGCDIPLGDSARRDTRTTSSSQSVP